ncbi:heme exporter protein CcmD [Martelella alba]|uniref:Heme exporter protein D n=1 Tax=Martelella alba TaxID=2590451 RepID=A0A506UC35_9HYPH|nr:heme exporter protein CcmD [Martelella alba]TPW30966.1 heme exporter protein CcmD [Martelella alba]
MDHFFFVFSAYGASLSVMLALIAWLFFDGRARRRELAALEEKGLRRRSVKAIHE